MAVRGFGLRVAAGVAVLVVVGGACSSSKTTAGSSSTTTVASSSSSPTTAAAAGGALQTGLGNGGGGPLVDEANTSTPVGPVGSGLTRGITATSVSMGCVYTANSYAGFQTGIQARLNAVNSAGGVNGRKINLVACKDDANSPQTNVTDTQQLVNQNGVFGIFTLGDVELPGTTDFLVNNQVPFYGWGFLPGFCGTRWGFGWNGCVAGNGLPKSNQVTHEAIQGNLALAIIQALGMQPSQVRLGATSEDNTAGSYGAAQLKGVFTAIGATLAYNKANFPNGGTSDVTPYVQALIAANPNIVYLDTPFNDVGPMATGLKAAGYKGITMDFTNYLPGLLAASPQLAQALQGEYVNTQIVPQEQNTPFIQQIQTSLKAIGQPPFVTLGGEMGYIEAELLIEQLQAAGPTLNTKTFDQTVNGGNFTSFANLQGGPGKLVWPAAHLLPSDCAAILKITGTNYQLIKPFTCYQSFKVF